MTTMITGTTIESLNDDQRAMLARLREDKRESERRDAEEAAGLDDVTYAESRGHDDGTCWALERASLLELLQVDELRGHIKSEDKHKKMIWSRIGAKGAAAYITGHIMDDPDPKRDAAFWAGASVEGTATKYAYGPYADTYIEAFVWSASEAYRNVAALV